MGNVIYLNPPQENKDEWEEMMELLKNQTDQLVFIRVDTEGKVSLGHTPLEVNDLIVMYHHLGRFIQNLIEMSVTEDDNSTRH